MDLPDQAADLFDIPAAFIHGCGDPLPDDRFVPR